MDTTSGIIEFLTARLDEDDAMARCAGHGCGRLHEHNAGWVEVDLPDEHNARPSYEMRFIRTHSPERVLREVEAKRRVVGYALGFRAAANSVAGGDLRADIRKDAADMMAATAEDALKPLAAVYADHPDYEEAWRP